MAHTETFAPSISPALQSFQMMSVPPSSTVGKSTPDFSPFNKFFTAVLQCTEVFCIPSQQTTLPSSSFRFPLRQPYARASDPATSVQSRSTVHAQNHSLVEKNCHLACCSAAICFNSRLVRQNRLTTRIEHEQRSLYGQMSRHANRTSINETNDEGTASEYADSLSDQVAFSPRLDCISDYNIYLAVD